MKLFTRKGLILLLVCTSIGVAVGEVVLRLCFGFGQPPLSIVDPEFEYMFKPNQELVRFGNRIHINQFGMRSDDITIQHVDGVKRIIIYGDSVLNGGALTDQAELATSLLKRRLEGDTGMAIEVGNVSAGSWGPGNWLNYSKKHGFFNADVVAVVVSAHDAADNPTYLPLNQMTHPTVNPKFAIWEVWSRYVSPRLFPEKLLQPPHADIPTEEDLLIGLGDLRQFLELAKAASPRVEVFYHPERAEAGEFNPGYKKRLHQLVDSMSLSFHDLTPFYVESGLDMNAVYRDEIHPSAVGQAVIAEAFMKVLDPNGTRVTSIPSN